jgi:hypothetical protein
MVRFDLFDRDTVLQCFVLDVLDETVKGPDVVSLYLW